MSERPLVSIIIVTMNTPRLTRGCLESIRRNSTVPHEVIVVSNSKARPLRLCLADFPGARVISNPRNFAQMPLSGASVLRGRRADSSG